MAAKDIRICFIADSFVDGTGDETYPGWAGRLCANVRLILQQAAATCQSLMVAQPSVGDNTPNEMSAGSSKHRIFRPAITTVLTYASL